MIIYGVCTNQQNNINAASACIMIDTTVVTEGHVILAGKMQVSSVWRVAETNNLHLFFCGWVATFAGYYS